MVKHKIPCLIKRDSLIVIFLYRHRLLRYALILMLFRERFKKESSNALIPVSFINIKNKYFTDTDLCYSASDYPGNFRIIIKSNIRIHPSANIIIYPVMVVPKIHIFLLVFLAE